MKKNILVIAGVVGSVLFIIYSWNTAFFTGTSGYGYDSMYNNHMFFRGGGIFHMFWMGLFFYMIFRLYSGDENRTVYALKTETAEEILKKEYVAGKIQKDEFQTKMKALIKNDS